MPHLRCFRVLISTCSTPSRAWLLHSGPSGLMRTSTMNDSGLVSRESLMLHSSFPVHETILTIDELLTERERLHGEGKTLVFTNGVFDILHVGHVRYLEQARALGDALVVAINSGRWVGELKGSDRPLMTENERAELRAALRAGDYVTWFDEGALRTL